MLQRPNPLANRRRQAAANKIFVSLLTILAQKSLCRLYPCPAWRAISSRWKHWDTRRLRFQRILDDSTIQHFAQRNCISYDVPVETSLSLVKERTLCHEHGCGFVASQGNKPVSTATQSTKAASFCSWDLPIPFEITEFCQ